MKILLAVAALALALSACGAASDNAAPADSPSPTPTPATSSSPDPLAVAEHIAAQIDGEVETDEADPEVFKNVLGNETYVCGGAVVVMDKADIDPAALVVTDPSGAVGVLVSSTDDTRCMTELGEALASYKG